MLICFLFSIDLYFFRTFYFIYLWYVPHAFVCFNCHFLSVFSLSLSLSVDVFTIFATSQFSVASFPSLRITSEKSCEIKNALKFKRSNFELVNYFLVLTFAPTPTPPKLLSNMSFLTIKSFLSGKSRPLLYHFLNIRYQCDCLLKLEVFIKQWQSDDKMMQCSIYHS